MEKQKTIEKAEKLLSDNGFNKSDYVISLQGPTVILTETGNNKMNNDLDVKIELIKLIQII